MKTWEIKIEGFLPSYLKVFATEVYDPTAESRLMGLFSEGDDYSVNVTIHSEIHVNKEVTMPPSWTRGFINKYPARFIGDIQHYINTSY